MKETIAESTSEADTFSVPLHRLSCKLDCGHGDLRSENLARENSAKSAVQ